MTRNWQGAGGEWSEGLPSPASRDKHWASQSLGALHDLHFRPPESGSLQRSLGVAFFSNAPGGQSHLEREAVETGGGKPAR